MTQPPLFLAIDCGTQSLRVIAFDLQGQLVAKAQVAIDDYFSREPNWSELHTHVIWDAVCRACHQLWDESQLDRSRIAGVAVTSQRASIICLDENGEPVRPMITWMDQRRATELPKLDLKWKAAFKLAGVDDTVNQFLQDAEINWLKQHEQSNLDKTHKVLLVSGYLNFKLSGEFKDSVGSQVGYIPFDYKNHQWARKTDWKWQACPIDESQLPQLVSVGTELGTISKAAFQQTGLPEGLPIIASAADKACEVLGSGVLAPHQGQISYGTTATINVIYSKYIESVKYVPPYPAAIPNHYCCEYQIYRGYWMVSWFKQQFAHFEQFKAQQSGDSVEALLDQQASKIPPGSEGLVLQPYWSPGVRYPGPEARGAIIGFNDQHTRAHVYRAVLEGIAFGLFEGKNKIESKSKTKITELLVSGGGSQSRSALQLTADIFNLPVKVPHTFETSALGAAINVAVSCGYYSSYPQAVEQMCHIGETLLPIEKNVQLYKRIYHDVFAKMYQQLKPLYKVLKKLS